MSQARTGPQRTLAYSKMYMETSLTWVCCIRAEQVSSSSKQSKQCYWHITLRPYSQVLLQIQWRSWATT